MPIPSLGAVIRKIQEDLRRIAAEICTIKSNIPKTTLSEIEAELTEVADGLEHAVKQLEKVATRVTCLEVYESP